jgi:Transcriptional regulator
LRHATEAAQVARRAARGEVGSLGIGFFGSASSPFLPSLVQSYRQKFPDVQLRLHEMTPDQQLAAFDDGRIDLGFSRKLPPDRRAEFEEENVYTDQLGVALSPFHRLARERIVRLKELASEQFVQFHRKGARTLFDEVIAVCRRGGFSPAIVSEADFMATVLTLVESGLCVSVVPSCVRCLKRPVVIKPIIPKSAQIPLCATWRKSDQGPVLMAFLKILRELKSAIRKQMEERPWEEIRPIRLPNKSQPVRPLNQPQAADFGRRHKPA